MGLDENPINTGSFSIWYYLKEINLNNLDKQ